MKGCATEIVPLIILPDTTHKTWPRYLRHTKTEFVSRLRYKARLFDRFFYQEVVGRIVVEGERPHKAKNGMLNIVAWLDHHCKLRLKLQG